jgi:iron(III) transport system permease protein
MSHGFPRSFRSLGSFSLSGALCSLLTFLPFTFFCFAIVLPLSLYFLPFLTSAFTADLSVPLLFSLAPLLLRTFGIALAASLGAVVFGVLVFAAIESLPPRARRQGRERAGGDAGAPGRGAARAIALLPFFIPGHYLAIAWIQTAGNAGWLTSALASLGVPSGALPAALYSPWGCAALTATRAYPIALALIWAGMREAPRSILEAGATHLAPHRLWRLTLAGPLRPWLSVAALIVFLFTLLDYSIPSSLQVHVFPVEVMTAYIVDFDPARARVLAAPLVAAALAAAFALHWPLRRTTWPADRSQGARLPPLRGAAGGSIRFAALAVVAAGAFVPILTLALMAGGAESYRTIFISGRSQLASSFTSSTVAATGVLVLGGSLAAVGAGGLLRSASPFGRFASLFIAAAMLACFALPGSIAGMAHIAFWNAAEAPAFMHALYDGGFMLPLGLLTLLTPIGYWIFRARARATPRALLEIERLTPARPTGRWLAIAPPRFGRPAAVAAALAWVLAMQEVHASILLEAPGRQTMSVRALTLLHQETDAHVAAFCLIALATTAAGLGAIFLAASAAGAAWVKWGPDAARD